MSSTAHGAGTAGLQPLCFPEGRDMLKQVRRGKKTKGNLPDSGAHKNRRKGGFAQFTKNSVGSLMLCLCRSPGFQTVHSGASWMGSECPDSKGNKKRKEKGKNPLSAPLGDILIFITSHQQIFPHSVQAGLVCFHLGCQQGRFCCSFRKTPKSRGRGDPAPTADFQGCRVGDGKHPELLTWAG